MKGFRTSNQWIVAAAYVALNGCAGPMNDPAGKHLHEQWVAQCDHVGMPFDNISSVTQRNDFIFRLKAVKDYEYDNYVKNLRRATSWGEFASDSVKIILDSLVAVTGGTETKAALGAASAGLTGAATSVKKNVLFDQSITTFITKMDTLRLTKWNEILCKMGRGVSSECRAVAGYTAAEAFADLQEYGRCGTLDAALRGVDAQTSKEKKQAEEANAKIKGIPTIDQVLEPKGANGQ